MSRLIYVMNYESILVENGCVSWNRLLRYQRKYHGGCVTEFQLGVCLNHWMVMNYQFHRYPFQFSSQILVEKALKSLIRPRNSVGKEPVGWIPITKSFLCFRSLNPREFSRCHLGPNAFGVQECTFFGPN